MTELENQAVDTVDGSSFSQDEYELAIDNGIEVTGFNNDEPKSEVVEEVVEVPSEELESVDPEVVGEVATEELTEEVDNAPSNDPFGASSVESDAQVEDEDDDFKSLPRGFKNRLKRKDRQVGRLERELNELKAQLSQPQAPQTNKVEEKYGRQHFASDDEYIDYLTTTKANESVQRIIDSNAQAQAQQQDYTAKANSWNEKVANNIPESEQTEYLESISALGNPSNVFNEEIVQYMFQHQNGPKILKYFADRPQAIEQVNKAHKYELPSLMNSVAQFVSQSASPVKPVATKAPAPAGSLTNKTNGVTVKSIDNMSDQELLDGYESGTLKFT